MPKSHQTNFENPLLLLCCPGTCMAILPGSNMAPASAKIQGKGGAKQDSPRDKTRQKTIKEGIRLKFHHKLIEIGRRIELKPLPEPGF